MPALTPEIAEALYIGVVTDTGRFQYSNTTSKALRLAADLVDAGADVHGIFRHVYETVQFAKLKLLARALEHAQAYEGGRLVISYLLRSDFADAGAEEPFSEGIIDFLRASEGSELVALIREPPTAGGPSHRVSLRSSSDAIDVSAIARKSGGGGHVQAAGFSSEQPLEEIVEFIRARIRRRRRPAGLTCRREPRPRSGSRSSTSRRGRRRSRSSPSLRRRTRARTGHAGTLDPFASGLLVLLSGAATRLAPCFVGLDKRYVTTVDLTSTTSTGDPEGDERRAARRRRRRTSSTSALAAPPG